MSALTPGEPKQLPPTSKLGQQPGTTGNPPNGIATEPAANQSPTERVPAAGPVQLAGETVAYGMCQSPIVPYFDTSEAFAEASHEFLTQNMV